MPRSVGIRELAEDLGVSIGSVSTAINNPHLVSDRMRERVAEASERLGFVPNGLARQLRAGASTTVGMIVLDIANPFFAALAAACQQAAEANGLNVIIASSNQDDTREDRLAHLFEEQRVRGLLVVPVNGPSRSMAAAQKRGLPMVFFDDIHTSPDFCSVAMDGYAAGQKAIEHLNSRGRRHIAFIGGPIDQVSDRYDGAHEAALALNITLDHIPTAAQTVELGRIAAARLLANKEHRPDGIFAANDQLALGVLQAVQAHPELQVPRDLSVVGVDDTESAASAAIPLTTLRQPLGKIALSAIELLEAHVEGEHSHVHVELEPELIVRKSS